MKRLFNPCRRYRQDICLLAGGALPEPERNQIENHLAACAHCLKYYEEMKTAAVQLAEWAQSFPEIQPTQAMQVRWARAVQSASTPKPFRRVTPAMAFRAWWQDVIRPCRRVWAALAAVWVVILAGNFSLHEHSQTFAVKSSPQAMIMSFKDQQKILAELFTERSPTRDAEPQRFFPPKPRTESIGVAAG